MKLQFFFATVYGDSQLKNNLYEIIMVQLQLLLPDLNSAIFDLN